VLHNRRGPGPDWFFGKARCSEAPCGRHPHACAARQPNFQRAEVSPGVSRKNTESSGFLGTVAEAVLQLAFPFRQRGTARALSRGMRWMRLLLMPDPPAGGDAPANPPTPAVTPANPTPTPAPTPAIATAPAVPAAGAPPRVALAVVNGKTEAEIAAEAALVKEREERKREQQRIAELEDENRRLKTPPTDKPDKSFLTKYLYGEDE
jgi:hypothetical protein